jgi:DNA polymerase epsilon subunit 3
MARALTYAFLYSPPIAHSLHVCPSTNSSCAQDLLLPRSLISRLTRGVLPPNTSLQRDAILALTRSATVFVSYLAAHANEASQLRHRKTLGVQDVYAALKEIEFEKIMEMGVVGTDGRMGGRLEREVEMYERTVGEKRRGYRDRVKARESGVTEGEEVDDGERSSKKLRRTSQDEDDESMLERQLNGGAGPSSTAPQSGTNGHSNDKGKSRQLDGDGDDPDPDQTEPEEDPRDDEDDDGVISNEDDEENESALPARNGDDMSDGEQVDAYIAMLHAQERRPNGEARSRPLLPNGEVDMEGQEDSD